MHTPLAMTPDPSLQSNGQAADSPAFLLKDARQNSKNPKAKRPPEWEASSK
jgi:hypothetical protein